MAENSKIEWTNHTVNLWWGCSKVHAGCDNCYALDTSKRLLGRDIWGDENPRRKVKTAFQDLKKFDKAAKANGYPAVVFVGSMMDIFEKEKPIIDHNGDKVYTDLLQSQEATTETLRQDLFKEISLGKYDNLIFLFLTKRPSNIKKYIPKDWNTNCPKNVWFGTSVSDQRTADTLIPQLAKYSPLKSNKFLSVEPQLGEISIISTHSIQRINWIIQGGESGNNKRPFNLEWAYKMQKDCKALSIPYFFKQIDKVQQPPDDLQKELPQGFPILTL